MHLKTALFGLNFDAFEYSWDETGGATRDGLALLLECLNSVIVCNLEHTVIYLYRMQ